MKSKSSETFAKGDIVFAKCDGSEPWPAKILDSIFNQAKNQFAFKVKFFSHNSIAFLDSHSLNHFTTETQIKQEMRCLQIGNKQSLQILKAIKLAAEEIDKKSNNLKNDNQNKHHSKIGLITSTDSLNLTIQSVLNKQVSNNQLMDTSKQERSKIDKDKSKKQKMLIKMAKISQLAQYSKLLEKQYIDKKELHNLPQFKLKNQSIFQNNISRVQKSCNIWENSQLIANIHKNLFPPKKENKQIKSQKQQLQNPVRNKKQKPLQRQLCCDNTSSTTLMPNLQFAFQRNQHNPETEQLTRLSSYLDHIQLIIDQQNQYVTIFSQEQFYTLLHQVKSIQNKPNILQKIVNIVLKYQSQSTNRKVLSIEYALVRQKLQNICMMRHYLKFDEEVKNILIRYIRKSKAYQ